MDEKMTAPDCPCTGNCDRKGLCVLCIAHHREIGTLTACMKPVAEKVYGPKEA